MKLSAEQFAELAASFNTAQPSGRHDRRRAARLELQARIRIHPYIEDRRLDPVVVVVSNFSARGLSFIRSSVMEAGTQFITELPRKGGGSVELLCTVVHSVPVSGDLYRIGAEFTGVAPPKRSEAGDSAEMKRIRESMLG